VILPDLYGLLIRFRLFPIGIVADIKKAFLTIGLQVQDGFLRVKDPKDSNFDDNLQVSILSITIRCGIKPFFIRSYNLVPFKASWYPLADRLQLNIYVDNVVTGVKNLIEAKNFYTESSTFCEAQIQGNLQSALQKRTELLNLFVKFCTLHGIIMLIH